MLSHRPRVSRLSDLQLMGRLKNLSWLSSAQLKNLDESISSRTVSANDVIYRDDGKTSADTYILLLGTAQLSHVDARGPRAIAIMSPGLLFKFPLMPAEIGHNFELLALNDCRIASLSTDQFIRITLGISAEDYERVSGAGDGRLGGLVARYPCFVGLGLLERVVLALLELVNDFGVSDARGILLRISPTHQQLADLVGASRARVTRVLVELETRKIISREGRRLILNADNADKALRSNGNGRANGNGQAKKPFPPRRFAKFAARTPDITATGPKKVSARAL